MPNKFAWYPSNIQSNKRSDILD